MWWIILALVSALCLGFYDIFKKVSLRANNVLVVLFLNTLFGTLLLSWVLAGNIADGTFGLGGSLTSHLLIMGKAVIVLSSWILGYYAIKHLPLTIQGPINACRPVVVLVGALLIFGERLNWLQWVGILLGFASLYFISRLGAGEGFSLRHSRWLLMSIGAMALGAVSALYDKFLMGRFQALEVQAWYSLYQCLLMAVLVFVVLRPQVRASRFTWRWTILGISVFLTVADMAYFYCLQDPDSMISVVSMIRRGSVIVSFVYGVVALHEKNVRAKCIDLGVLLLSLACLVIGANL